MSDKPKLPKWWMVDVHTGERFCWVPGPTAEAALAVYRIQEPGRAGRVRAVRVDEPRGFEASDDESDDISSLETLTIESLGIVGDEDAGPEADGVAIVLKPARDAGPRRAVSMTPREAAVLAHEINTLLARIFERRES